MRVRMRRRSVSSFVSPGPRVPMPPPSRDSAAPEPTSRGSRYFSCASSTCSLPSRVRARRAKMSRMSCVRSTILRPTASSRLPQLRRRQLVVEDDDVDVASRRTATASVSILPRAEKRRRIRLRPLLQHAQHDVGAGRLRRGRPARRARARGRIVAESPVNRPTSAARSRTGGISESILALCPTAPRPAAAASAASPTRQRWSTAARRARARRRRWHRGRAAPRSPPRRCRGRRARAIGARRGDGEAGVPRQRDRDRMVRDPDAHRAGRRRACPSPESAWREPRAVSGPGHQRAASRSACGVISPAARTCARSAAMSVSADDSARPFSAYSRRTAPRCADRPPGHRRCRSERRRRARAESAQPLRG